MMVYVVKLIDEDIICGVFTTKDKAEKAIEIMQNEDDIFDGQQFYTKEEWREFFYIADYPLDNIYDFLV